jgi:hypothetical protein
MFMKVLKHFSTNDIEGFVRITISKKKTIQSEQSCIISRKKIVYAINSAFLL